ncbi:hypothetical protein L3V79_03300 [Thiotrichales bacterium 19S9-12]|nr:hypothetical protein [Thiotrichales bacterium 19S9-11]MCF6811387.1 hypothetical protein [Thiotrichales bacterium 19S9-12]
MPGENDKQYFDLQGNEFSLTLEGNKFKLISKTTNNSAIKLPDTIKADTKQSLIPIQQEMLFYTLRVIGALSTNDDRKDNQKKYFDTIYSKVYDLINNDLNKYLTGNPNASVKDINKYIDERRKDYIKLAESCAIQKFITNSVEFPPKQHIKDYLYYKTAADLDMVIYNPTTGIVTEITGPDDQNSSHSKEIALPAVMVMKHYRMNDDDSYYKNKPLQIQYRVPSLATPKIQDENGNDKSIKIQQQLDSIALKINKDSGYETDLENSTDLEELSLLFNKEKTPHFTYNLLTSIPILFDPNSQEETARIIFEGIHKYNQSIQNTQKPICYALNLPINQHTHLLSYGPINETAKEALFMADLAMFNSLKESLPSGTNNQYLKILNDEYNEFLNSENRPALFCKSEQAKAFQKAAVNLKNEINNIILIGPESHDKKNILAKTLLKLYATNYHGENSDQMEHQKEMASIIQGMHLSLTQHNLKGCKSANERFSFIENLNELFLAYHSETFKNDIPEKVKDALTEYLTKVPPTPQDGYNLAVKLHKINDDYNVYGTGTFPSMLDTGTPKDKTDENGNQESLAVSGAHTNYYRPELYENVYQHNASFEQAHGKMLKRLPEEAYRLLADREKPAKSASQHFYEEIQAEQVLEVIAGGMKFHRY